ncbi:alpha/beta hydrolase [Streptomyces sp. NPDC048623]|uniref:alpha/beta hydrolase n=1 Tax=Streptomyces sp. NPDC048623 TaxID=3155761 RepID=UPI003420DAD2
MKPRLVFVHGIGAPRDAAAELDEWLRAVAAGARAAGHSAQVSALTRGWAADARFAHYGDLFRTAGAQGTGAARTTPTPAPALAPTPARPDASQSEGQDDTLLAALLLEAVDARLADPASLTPAEAGALRAARTRLAPPAGAQGAGAPARHVVNAVTSLLAVPGLRAVGGWVSARVTAGILGQVARYLNRAESDGTSTLDQRIRARVADCLDPHGPNIVVAHSLGTVVALETLHEQALREHPVDVPLFVTLGSPLGIRTAVGPRVRPHLGTPENVGRWLNFWDRDDLVAARPRLEDVVKPNAAGTAPVSHRVDSDGAWVHPAAKYLAQPAVAGPLVEALTTLAER